MKNKFFKYFLLMVTFLALSGCMEEKEVQGPIPWEPNNRGTPINPNNPNTYTGTYIVTEADVTKTGTNSIVGLKSMAGGFVINYDIASNSLLYNYALKYGGYPHNNADLQISNNNTLSLSDFTLGEDNYTIILNNPITINADNVVYEIKSISKNDDNILMITENTNNSNLDNLTINDTVKLCDPTISDGSDSDCSGAVGAMKYIGYYRIEEITCGGIIYIGGTDFAGEMTAGADLGEMATNSIVQVPISMKFQVYNDILKSCILTNEQANNNNLYFSEQLYNISLAGGLNLLEIFANVGLLGISAGTEQERTSYITYEPKTQTSKIVTDEERKNTTVYEFSPMLFNNNTVSMKLRIMKQQQSSNGINLPAPVTLDDIPYWIVNNTGIQ